MLAFHIPTFKEAETLALSNFQVLHLLLTIVNLSLMHSQILLVVVQAPTIISGREMI